MFDEIENFYGVYLLFSTNPKYLGWTYIGFTVNPNRRIKQHNKGHQAGGARRTHGRGPWDMTLIVHGFPNMISALRFEWAWTKPQISRRLRHLPKKRNNEKKFAYCIRVMCEMLRTGPWNRLPLTIRWLKQEYIVEFNPSCLPPSHMPIEYGPVKSIKTKAKVVTTAPGESSESTTTSSTTMQNCCICSLSLQSDLNTLKCFNCTAIGHTVCFAREFLRDTPTSLLPVSGTCPSCTVNILWGDLLRYKQGCYQNSSDTQAVNDADFQHWADELQI